MCVPFVHYLEAEIGAIQNVSPGRDNIVLTVKQRLVEVETISRFLHSFLSGWRGLYLHLRKVSGANVVLREKRLTPTSL